jgi:ABC-type uncharacterized transport system involved in gliding motility auxiliary subunit
MIDDLAGNSGLMEARSRTSTERPFSKMNAILEEATKNLREEQKNVQEEIQDWQKQIQEKSGQKAQGGMIIINETELNQLNSKIEEGEKKMRDIRKKFRETKDGAFTSYQAWNILGVPIGILLIGITVWLLNRMRLAAH